MSLVRLIEKNKGATMPLKTETINNELVYEKHVILNIVEHVNEDNICNSESDIFIKEEKKEFIDEQIDVKNLHDNDEWKYFSSYRPSKSNILKKIKDEPGDTKKEAIAVSSFQCDEVKFCKKEEHQMIDYNCGKDVVKEEVKVEKHSPLTESSIISTNNRLLDEESNELKSEYFVLPSDLSACPQRNTQFELSCDLEFHFQKEHNEQLKHHCEICEESYNSKRDSKHHNLHHHKKRPGVKEKIYTCSECSITFRLLRDMKLHIKTFHESCQLRCCYCTRVFDKKSALASHMDSHKRKFKPSHECEVCCKVFRFHSNLDRHMKIHSGHKPHICELCGMEFNRLEHLKLHKRRLKHVEIGKNSDQLDELNTSIENLFTCEICGLGCGDKQRLREHLKVHSDNRPHVCTVCNKAFKRLDNLKQHLLSHDGPLDFICNLCSKGFRRKAYLKQHMLVHTKEKKYVCDVCGKRYYKSCHVTEHKKKIHGIPKWQQASVNM